MKRLFNKNVFKHRITLFTEHRGAFYQFPFWCFYYYGGNKSTRRETGRDPAISSPRSFHGVKICRLVHTIAPAQYKKQEERMKKLVKS